MDEKLKSVGWGDQAAFGLHLSQSAMSRTPDRLRAELGDELLVCVGRNYELTPRASTLLDELGQVAL